MKLFKESLEKLQLLEAFFENAMFCRCAIIAMIELVCTLRKLPEAGFSRCPKLLKVL
ncbi:MAG: hypothetical protein K2M99_01885 [Treponemataceae bacterium]|nr:hypothetical protein [Treponemataceae bacterium]